MRPIVLLAALAAVCATALAAPASHAAVNPCTLGDQDNHLVADATQTGVISLLFYNAEGSRVTFYECVGGRGRRLGTNRVDPDPATNPPTALYEATAWSCDRLVRRFAAVTTLPDGRLATGAYSVRTVSCAHRFALKLPARVAPGGKLRVRVVDRWGTGGIRPRLCLAAGGGRTTCRRVEFSRAVAIASRSFRVDAPGRWRVELRVRDRLVQDAEVRVGAGAAVQRSGSGDGAGNR